jgi:hypothetical protein
MAKKQSTEISVQTLPNGYSLDVDGKGFMYYTVQDLLEGFFMHVGLRKTDYLDREVITNLMTACATWPKEGDAIQEAARLTAQVETLQERGNRNTSTINQLKKQLADTQQKLADTTAKLSRLLSAEKPVEKKQQPKSESKIVTRGDVVQKEKAPKTTSNITKGDVAPKTSKRKPTEPTATIPYSETVYQALMLPLTIDKTGLPTRVLSIMKIVGGSSNATVGDALVHTKAEFMKVRGFGKGVAEKLEAFLSKRKLEYGMNVEEILMKHAMDHNPNIK